MPPAGRGHADRMGIRPGATVTLVDCLTRDIAGCGHARAPADRPRRTYQSAGQDQPHWHAATRARLRRRKSAFGFHFVAADSRPQTEDPLHAGHRHPVPGRRRAAVPRRQLPERAEVHRTGQRRRLGADLLADQPVLRRCATQAVGVRGRRNALHHRQHHRAAADGGHPAVRAAAQGRPVRPGQDDAVHPLSGGRAGGAAGHRHRGAGRQRRAAAGLPLDIISDPRSSPSSSSCWC